HLLTYILEDSSNRDAEPEHSDDGSKEPLMVSPNSEYERDLKNIAGASDYHPEQTEDDLLVSDVLANILKYGTGQNKIEKGLPGEVVKNTGIR
ncbi:hypothetical protein, partial [Acinetobacter baumannii]|uniref:hypothetical protein n=1 Tax=Acinetobacter baumannii TaxID=470 RepID=UPI001C06B71C